jgi:hypothetical protein
MVQIRKTDPTLSSMINQWEQMFGCKVKVNVDDDGKYIVSPLERIT